MHVASACLFVYDHLTTLADEVELIWNSPWGAGNVLFLASRYIAYPEFILALYIELFGAAGSDGLCYIAYVYVTWSIVACISVAESVLVLRTWAIWDGRRVVLLGLAVLLFAITSVNGWIVVEYTKHTTVIERPGIVGCVVTSTTHTIGIAWVLISAFELVILLMTAAKGIKHFMESSSTLMGSLYRDGMLYYLALFAVSLVNMIFIMSAEAEYIILLAELQRAFHSIFCCRIILHLRAARSAALIPSIGTDTVSGWFGAQDHGRTAAVNCGV